MPEFPQLLVVSSKFGKYTVAITVDVASCVVDEAKVNPPIYRYITVVTSTEGKWEQD